MSSKNSQKPTTFIPSENRVIKPEYKPYVPKSENGETCVVRIRKQYQECDVYIGPEMYNNSWKVKRSKWCNPHYMPTNPQRALQLYRRTILDSPELRKALIPELSGKRLGCFCDNISQCHGSVLVELIRKHNSNNDFPNSKIIHYPIDQSTKCQKILYFKGDHIFSNLYESILFYENKMFNSIAQLWGYRDACKLNDQVLADKIYSAKSPNRALYYINQLRSKHSTKSRHIQSRPDTIKEMGDCIELKWNQNLEFQKKVSKYVKKGYILVESTHNGFWGSGLDIHLVTEGQDYLTLEGHNFLGWIIMYTWYKKNGKELKLNNYFPNEEYSSLRLGLKELLFTVTHC